MELYVTLVLTFSVLCTIKQPTDVSASLEICVTSEMFCVHTWHKKGYRKLISTRFSERAFYPKQMHLFVLLTVGLLLEEVLPSPESCFIAVQCLFGVPSPSSLHLWKQKWMQPGFHLLKEGWVSSEVWLSCAARPWVHSRKRRLTRRCRDHPWTPNGGKVV